MSLLVLAYPEISEDDYNWIQEYRKKNDAMFFSIIAPHFMIVSPTFDITEQDFINEIETLSVGVSPIEFSIRCAIVNKDLIMDVYHEFLIPDTGTSDIIKLRNKLYSGRLSPNLRLDITFLPHIGIGNSTDHRICKKRVDELNKGNIRIDGKIKYIDVTNYQNDSIVPLKKIKLVGEQ